MKKFLFISYGFETPTPEIMAAWGQWFGSMQERIVEQSMLGPGHSFAKGGDVAAVSGQSGGATGYLIFEAVDLEEAQKLASQCPVIERNVLQELISMGAC